MKKAVTLLELMVVVIIVGILAALALPNYFQSQENALTEEATANLKLIKSAEKIYRMEMGHYASWDPSIDHTSEINLDLSLAMPTASAKKWQYNVITDTVNSADFTAKAQRTGADARNYCINQIASSEEPYNVGCDW